MNTITDRDVSHHFAEFAAGLRYDDLPAEARDAAGKSILDTIGVILAASRMEPSARTVIDFVQHNGGREEADVLAFGFKAPAMMAALANGALAHCLDYDDQTPWGQHCASSIVPAVFAVAQARGGASGKDVIAAVAAGQDIFARLRCNVGWDKDWNLSTVLAIYAATASVGRVLGFDTAKIANAIGIASMQSSGVMEMIAGRGSDLRGVYAGFSAKGAVLAAGLAENGLTGIDRLFEGDLGVFQTYFKGRYDRAGMLEGLGTRFLGAQTLYKRWPCVGTAHSHIKAAIDIVADHRVDPASIARIKLHVGDYHNLMCQPLAERRSPATLADAKFSLPFLVAVAIARRGMSIGDFSEAGLRDPLVLEIGRKIELVQDAALDWQLDLPPGRVEIETHDGRRWLKVGLAVPGNADNPMTWQDVGEKFAECASASVQPPTTGQTARAIELARTLATLPDATDLLSAIC
jgi:2-methylcitrate dehydratase PrpD